MTGLPRLYSDLAWTWPIISPPEDYVKESEAYARLIRGRAPSARTLLHLGCGGGHNDATLKRTFRVTGVDLSEEMLALAGGLNPEAEYVRGDLRDARLLRNFDAAIALDALPYMRTEAELLAAFRTAAAHLAPGGVFLTCAEFTPDRWKESIESRVRSRGAVRVTFIEATVDPDPDDTTFESVFLFLITRGGELEAHTDRHTNGLFPLETWGRLLREAGFEVEETDVEGVPTFVGVRRGPPQA